MNCSVQSAQWHSARFTNYTSLLSALNSPLLPLSPFIFHLPFPHSQLATLSSFGAHFLLRKREKGAKERKRGEREKRDERGMKKARKVACSLFLHENPSTNARMQWCKCSGSSSWRTRHTHTHTHTQGALRTKCFMCSRVTREIQGSSRCCLRFSFPIHSAPHAHREEGRRGEGMERHKSLFLPSFTLRLLLCAKILATLLLLLKQAKKLIQFST